MKPGALLFGTEVELRHVVAIIWMFDSVKKKKKASLEVILANM